MFVTEEMHFVEKHSNCLESSVLNGSEQAKELVKNTVCKVKALSPEVRWEGE